MLRGTIGLRYWYSKSDFQFEVRDQNTYELRDSSSHSAELVFEIEDSLYNSFARATVGIGRTLGGDVTLFGVNAGSADDSTLGYVTVDGGWELYDFGNQTSLKGFVGYHFLRDRIVVDSGLPLTGDAYWNLMRVGVGIEGNASDKVSWAVDFAGIPFGGIDVQNFDSLFDGGYTYGFQTDAMLDFALAENFTLGVGGRYWWLKSDFESNALVGVDVNGSYQRYGLLVEGKYNF